MRSSEIYGAFYYRAFRLRLVEAGLADFNALTDSIVEIIDRRLGPADD